LSRFVFFELFCRLLLLFIRPPLFLSDELCSILAIYPIFIRIHLKEEKRDIEQIAKLRNSIFSSMSTTDEHNRDKDWASSR